MFEIGESLSAARKRQGLELRDVESLTCIRVKQLEALETEEFGALPGLAYTRVFLRTYARALGLNPEPFVAEFEERFPDPQPEAPARPPRRRYAIPTRIALGAVAVLTVIGFIVWANLTAKPTSPGPLTAPAAIRFPSSKPRTPVALSRTSAPGVSAVVTVAHAVRARRLGLAAAAGLRIRAARGSCWLLARLGGASGRVLYEATLEQGQAVTFAATGVWVRLGAPWNVNVTRAGRTVRGLSVTYPVDLAA